MQPFHGLKVLDFTTLLPGPFATQYFADWGADVLRIEAPDREDMSRSLPPFAHGISTTYAYLNRSKQTLALDLKNPVDHERILALVAEHDVLIEQFRPGVMAKLGLDYKTLQSINPRLIYCSLTGYGQTGPMAHKAGHDINYAALSGLAAMTGTVMHGPQLHGNPVCDLAGSFQAMIAILTALYHREKTGEAQYIDVSITDSSLAMSGLWLQMVTAAGVAPRWESTVLNGASFYGYYSCKDKQYLSVGGLEPKFLTRFLEAIDALEILDWNPKLPEHGANSKALIQARLALKTQADWLSIFSSLDVCVEPVLSLAKIPEHPQFKARQMFIEVPYAEGVSQTQLASPIRYSSLTPVYKFIGGSRASKRSRPQNELDAGLGIQ